MTTRRLFPALLLLLSAGCVSMAPRTTVPKPPVPEAWAGGAGTQGAAAPGSPASDLAWQDFYVDANLRKVLDLALKNNRDYRIAGLNVERVRAYYRIQRAELLPTIAATGVGHKQRLPASVSGTGQSTIVEQDSASIGVSAWELDFFGRVRSLKDRAFEEYLATGQARTSAQISLLAEVANLYLTLAADREGLNLAQATLTNQEKAYALVQRRFEAGATSEIDARRAQVGQETARGEVANFKRAVAMDENALNLLAGIQVPAELLPQSLGAVTALKDITPGLPSDVLIRRPDIRMAENNLRAANANIGAARAAFFPRIALTTQVGTMGSQLSGLFKPGAYTWEFAPQVSLPLFQGGANLANLKASKVERDIAVANYEKTVQIAFREVSDTLAQRGTLHEQLTAQEALVTALETTHRLALARYNGGIDSYLGVLDAQRSLYSAQQGLISLRRASHGNLVTLYKVLGGGSLEGR